jgi:hypothetical protein
VLYLQSGISDGKAARNLTYVAPVHQQGLDTTTPAGKAMFQTARARNARCGMAAVKSGSSAMKEALQSAFIIVLWIAFWLAGTLGGAVLQARLIDIGVLSDIDPPWIITVGSSFIGFFAGAYAAVKLGDLALNQK